jgi:hypothetical protein
MKLEVPCLEVCDVPEQLIENLLDSIEERDWFAKDFRKEFGNLGASDSILLRHSIMCGDISCHDNDAAIEDLKNQPLYDKFSAQVEPFLSLLREHYVFNEYAAFIARMHSNAEIDMHVDRGNFLSKCHRVHIPLQTNERVAYCIGDQEYYWRRGKAYEFDNTRPHGVKNRSSEFRIHLIVNLYNIEDQT